MFNINKNAEIKSLNSFDWCFFKESVNQQNNNFIQHINDLFFKTSKKSLMLME